MTIEQVRSFMDKLNGLCRNDGDIDDYWEAQLTDSIRIEFMLTHTRWCQGENNDEHELLLFVIDDDKDNYEPISLLSFTEKITEE